MGHRGTNGGCDSGERKGDGVSSRVRSRHCGELNRLMSRELEKQILKRETV